ncbi:Gmad2 immunoglobulin-like domain-containing protein [Fodinibius salsisoli]|uniref:Gmad2 immunoglobulin-like domain-containing protein n=1 Tax=Fodinibius salsisoli TaxID=2820877 RepID=A0ABT3PM54_9BACT|nr:Gmad2 immunoglobulin-like domain-containing protein [Fodinibius salsisoli]MCW9707028.1 Gmad2 immunoglobulin-like domain-containing protein [Fodinibius salsisoli]
METYSNATYNLRLEIPTSWVVVEQSDLKVGDFAINIFSKNTEPEGQLPINVHAEPQHSYITIWPKGIGTELPNSQYTSFTKANNAPSLSFEVDTTKSKILHLADGTPWAYFIVPQAPPANWSKNGFIFAQIRMTNSKTLCYDEQVDQQKSMEECDFLEGDKVVRKGTLNNHDAEIIHHMLGNLTLEEIGEKETARDMIEVKKPLPNMDVTSPLTVIGKAKGYWYFEGSFTIKLYDAHNNLLAETAAQAKEDWMTEQFVPFEATLTYDAPDDQRGRLVFERANPSGKAENAQMYSIPVIFPPK